MKPVIAVAGSGRMGIGIAQVFAYAGYRVELIDMKERPGAESQAVLENALLQIRRNLEALSSFGLLSAESVELIISRIYCHEFSSLKDALISSAIVFEAVPEVLEIKEAAFKAITRVVNEEALIASTTSTFLVDTLASYVTNSSRFMNTHWLNPAYLIPLVEVSPGNRTDAKALEEMLLLLESVGKVPVKCAAKPGFIVPRIQALAMNEAARMVEEGVASPEDIDKAVRVGFGLRFAVLGLLEFIDWGGGDILYYASNYLKESLGSDRFTPPAIISRNMEEGLTGLRAGRGFYDFTERDVAGYQQETIRKFVELLCHMGLITPPAVD